MTTAELVYEHLKRLPEATVGTVFDFVEFLEEKERRARPTESPREQANAGPRQPGSARGQVWMAPDFDEPLDDFKDYQ